MKHLLKLPLFFLIFSFVYLIVDKSVYAASNSIVQNTSNALGLKSREAEQAKKINKKINTKILKKIDSKKLIDEEITKLSDNLSSDLNSDMNSEALLFQSYYKIFVENKEVGFFVFKFNQNPDTLNFIYTSYLYTNIDGNSLTETLKTKSDHLYEPLEYTYTKKNKNELRRYKAKVVSIKNKEFFEFNLLKKNLITGKKRTKTKKTKKKKGVFFSSVLPYIAFSQTHSGLPIKMHFSALSEETTFVKKGHLYLENKGNHFLDPFHLKVVYAGKRVDTYFDIKGNMTRATSPDYFIVSERSNDLKKIKYFTSQKDKLKKIFGSIPFEENLY